MTVARRSWNDMRARLLAQPFVLRVAVIAGVAALGLVVAALAPPEHQFQAYHDFAPSGPGNLGIVLSNLAFLVVGVWGLWITYGQPTGRPIFEAPGAERPYAAFFAGVVLVTFGSGYYHLDPNDSTLVWDRLAMTVIFMGLLSAFIADRIDIRAGTAVALPALLAFGAVSIAYWDAAGDLRAYHLVQALPIALIPLLCLLFPGRLTRFRYVVWMALWFALATLAEFFDHEVHRVLAIGGHAIKHPLAAIACYAVIAMLRDAARRIDRQGEVGR